MVTSQAPAIGYSGKRVLHSFSGCAILLLDANQTVDDAGSPKSTLGA
jgi:hypothetical protein